MTFCPFSHILTLWPPDSYTAWSSVGKIGITRFKIHCDSSFYADMIFSFQWADEKDPLKNICVNRRTYVVLDAFLLLIRKGGAGGPGGFQGFSLLIQQALSSAHFG